MALADEILGQGFDSFVEFSWILGYFVVHHLLGVKGSNDEEVLCLANAGASLFLR